MPVPTRPRFFFVHLMKTGGTTFAQHLVHNFAAHERYPTATDKPTLHRQYYMIDEVLAHRRAHPETCAYAGHFPFVVSTIVEADITLTLLREPV